MAQDEKEKDLFTTAMLVALGITRAIRNDLEDWKEWYLGEGEAEWNEWKESDIWGKCPATKEDVEALSRKIDGLGMQGDPTLLQWPKKP